MFELIIRYSIQISSMVSSLGKSQDLGRAVLLEDTVSLFTSVCEPQRHKQNHHPLKPTPGPIRHIYINIQNIGLRMSLAKHHRRAGDLGPLRSHILSTKVPHDYNSDTLNNKFYAQHRDMYERFEFVE
ncbi:hypothetical protein RR48_13714 [Papilio machaon]|uniref:Uncharacterized protein n=1 Tax=Papilio machaon TaxID=76193 RepID=A0A194RGB3_PAPMA|nr:hypothetical protein RR48_13714 [Papilio machaon]